MLDTEMHEAAAAVLAAAALAAISRRVVATGNRASAERAQPRSPWKEGGQGKRRRGRCRLCISWDRVPLQRPAIPSGCDARRAPPKGLLGRGCLSASGASNHWCPPRMQHGSSGLEDWGLFQSAGVGGGRGLPRAPAGSLPSSESALLVPPPPSWTQPRATARTRLASPPRPLFSTDRHLAVRGLFTVTLEDRVAQGDARRGPETPERCLPPRVSRRALGRAGIASPGG